MLNGINKAIDSRGAIGDIPPDEEWNKTYYIPSRWTAMGNCIQVTPDGGYIVTGDVGGAEQYSAYLLKIDDRGKELWNRTFGGDFSHNFDNGYWVEVTDDNGYIITGRRTRILPNALNPQTSPRDNTNIGNDGKFYAFDIYPGENSAWFDPTTPGVLNYLGPNTADSFISAGTWGNDIWYAAAYYGGLYVVDPTTGAMTLIGGSTPLFGLGFDDSSGYLYGCDATNLYEVNMETGATTLVGPFNTGGLMIDMAIDGYGNAYGHDIANDAIYKIDLTTGATTLIGPTGIDCNYGQGMGYDKDNGVLYLAAYTSIGQLYTCDITTGHCTLVGNFQGGDEVDGLAIPYNNIHHYSDAWLIRTDANGIELWNRTFGGGGGSKVGHCVKQTKDGGYIVAGTDNDHLLLYKTDASGTEVWHKTYAFENYSEGYSLALTADGGYIITGQGVIITGQSPASYLLLMKTDENGTVEWEKDFFANTWPYHSCGYSAEQTSDGGYIVGGSTSDDLLLMKTDQNGSEVWNQTYGDIGSDSGCSVLQAADGDYIVGGTRGAIPTDMMDKFWLIRTHPNGTVVWNQLYPILLSSRYSCMQQTPDNGFIATGAAGDLFETKCVIFKLNVGNNRPPSSSSIEGPSWGLIETNYSFCINATDPDGDALYCMWDWGDGNITGWLGPVPPK